jgi:molybdopterin-guanine dinucleotide biosynthesis protein A
MEGKTAMDEPGSHLTKNIVGIVLVGGASRRMGSNKAFLRLGKRSFAQIAVSLLKTECEKVYLVGGQARDYEELGIPHIHDDIPDMGPLGGISSAFSSTGAQQLFVLACDLPVLKPSIVRSVIMMARQGGDVVFVSSGPVDQPLVGVYSNTIQPLLMSYLASGGRGVLKFLHHCKENGMQIVRHELADAARSLINVNAPSAIELLKKEGTIVYEK